ncbi:zinc finger and BTB domain-containing protein 49 isoform X3 [Alosa pseudoharengus]|uniref:zinc finger and BTB domain-containing protein 49 isoform X3 n=1 Tax=Alosa pseudoharengus TaxID=34774 RepID=UPI003F88D65F
MGGVFKQIYTARTMEGLSSHSTYLLQQLQEQRIQGMLCDCMLVVKGVCFKAHKNVLAAFSSYFRSLFHNTTGQRNDVFHLVIQDVGGIGQVLDYMYTSHLELNHENVQALLDIAQYLQVPNILSMCNSFPKSCASSIDSSTFSMPGGLSQEQDCMMSGNLPPEIDLMPTETQKPLNISVEEDQSKQDSHIQENISIDMVTNMTTASIKQPLHGYKLRNFSSKQYFKQSAVQTCYSLSKQSQDQVLVEGTFSAECTNNTIDYSPACQRSAIPMDQDPSTPRGSISVASDSTYLPAFKSPLSRPVRSKKAVYLKKYNYLCSERMDVKMHISKSQFTEHCVNKGLQDETELSLDERVAPENLEDSTSGSSHKVSIPSTVNAVEICSESSRAPPRQSRNRNYCCEICRKAFKHPSNLELHKRSHTGEKPFQCNICGKHFSQSGNLQTHLRRHSGEKPYICELCGKSFAASGDVQRHIVIHTGEKPHLCDVCGRGFSNFCNLKEHEKTHSTDKEFTCDQCGKSFNMHRKLQKHKIRHSGDRPHSCQTCGRSFGSTGDLRRHIRSHSGEKPYSCEMCGKSFTRSAVLRQHHSIHYKSVTGVGHSSDRKETDQANKPPQSHPAMTVKALRTLNQRYGSRIQQIQTAPPSDVPTEQSSSSTVMELQHTVPRRILAAHSGKYPVSDTSSKNPLSIEVSFCPFSGDHGPATSLQAADP